jgi:hypothetical protein
LIEKALFVGQQLHDATRASEILSRASRYCGVAGLVYGHASLSLAADGNAAGPDCYMLPLCDYGKRSRLGKPISLPDVGMLSGAYKFRRGAGSDKGSFRAFAARISNGDD